MKKLCKCFNVTLIICIVVAYLIMFHAIFLWFLVNTNVCCYEIWKKVCVCVCVYVCVCVCGGGGGLFARTGCRGVRRLLLLIPRLILLKDANKKVCALNSDCWRMKGTIRTYGRIGWLQGWRRPLFINKRWLQMAVTGKMDLFVNCIEISRSHLWKNITIESVNFKEKLSVNILKGQWSVGGQG